jgi:Tryptophan-associated transmembrane protein (Trp_oprn_chp)
VRRNGIGTTLVALGSALGGLLLVGGALLPWIDTGGVNIGTQVISATVTGLETSTGYVVLAAGIVAVLGAIVLISTRRASRVVAVALIVAGAAGLAGALMILTSPRDAYIDFAADELGVGSSEVTNSLTSLFDIGGINDDPGEGIYVSLAGGALTFLSGAIGALVLRRRRVQPAASADEGDPGHGPEAKGTVWERSFDEIERSADHVEKPTAALDAVPKQDPPAPAEEPTVPKRKEVLGDSWAG